MSIHKTWGTPMRKTWMVCIDSERWTVGLVLRYCQFSAGCWQVGLVLPWIAIYYVF